MIETTTSAIRETPRGAPAAAHRSGPAEWRAGLGGVAWFLGLTAAVTAGAVAASGSVPSLVPFLLVLGPAAIALSLAWREGGGALGRLLRSAVARPADRRWYLVLLLPVAWALGVVVVSIALGAAPAGPFDGAAPSSFIVPLVVIVPAFAEELAWRGYALPRAMRVMSPLAACLLLGLPWAAMHVVLHLPGGVNAGAAIWPAVVSVLAYSVILGWVYLGTGGSVLIVALVHTGLNSVVPFMAGIDPATSWQVRAILAVLVAVTVVALGGLRSPRPTPSSVSMPASTSSRLEPRGGRRARSAHRDRASRAA